MLDTSIHHNEPAALKRESIAFTGIFLVGFTVFLLIAVVAEMLAWKWRSWLPGAEENNSLISDVKGAVYTFMSHLF
jgi:light-harvesting complex 1 beta chain